MNKPANKTRGEVDLSEAGDGAIIRFNVDALERLQSEYGEDYIDVVIKQLSKVNPKTYKACIAAAGEHIPETATVPFGLTWEELNVRILDALFMAIHGRNYAEQQAYDKARSDQELDELQARLEKDPRLAAYLSSKLHTTQDTESV